MASSRLPTIDFVILKRALLQYAKTPVLSSAAKSRVKYQCTKLSCKLELYDRAGFPIPRLGNFARIFVLGCRARVRALKVCDVPKLENCQIVCQS